MVRTAVLLYGVIVYLLMVMTLIYVFGFIANVGVPKGIDGDATVSPGVAALINLGLIALFGIPHSVMARPAFKLWWTRFVPEAIERSTYVLVSTLLTILWCWQWQPMSAVIWHSGAWWARALGWGLYGLGIVILLASTCLVNHSDLFGLRQVYLSWKNEPYTHLGFKVTSLYRFVRHPLYVGWFLILWCTPSMSLGHLLLAVGLSSYILIAIRYEERDLKALHGETYEKYARRVPMLVPIPGKVHETVPAGSSPVPT